MDVGAAGERLSASGLIVVNPSFGFEEEMRAACNILLPQLSQGAGAHADVTWLAEDN